ncbi:hypothetical protein B6U98_03065 [Thermoplasmatales archaeon ex4572_165]|nr:MAG: hypothetical protein B6U98_03065 [Thermoplasmatales archaeon ex4572_165]RLF58998.1 MAG: hypothetical protein DRN27_03860 [Thermoplasmata archaeon]
MNYKIKKKILIIFLIFSFISINVTSFADDNSINDGMNEIRDNFDDTSRSTHKTLVEIATSQGCSGCSDWNTIMYNEYSNGIYNFDYVEMIVYDFSWDILNNVTNVWKNMFNISIYPTSVFDGGHIMHSGSNPEYLPNYLESCQNRTVIDINASIDVIWYHPSTLEISISITNNEPFLLNGSIRSHITEILSRYYTTQGHKYHNGFLDFAFNKDIIIPPYETYNDTVIWDANLHKDAHGDSFGDITQDNIKVYLGVFDKNGLCEELVTTTPVNATQYIDINQSFFSRGFPIRHAVDGNWAAGQNFLPTNNTFSSAEIYLRRFGTPEFNLTAELRENSVNGYLLDTLVFQPNEISSTWEWLTLEFLDINVSSEVEYFIVIPPAPSNVNTSFGYEWGYAFGNPYDDGAFWFTRDGGDLWRDLPSMYEFTFRTYRY